MSGEKESEIENLAARIHSLGHGHQPGGDGRSINLHRGQGVDGTLTAQP
jgi:hypothetical protein